MHNELARPYIRENQQILAAVIQGREDRLCQFVPPGIYANYWIWASSMANLIHSLDSRAVAIFAPGLRNFHHEKVEQAICLDALSLAENSASRRIVATLDETEGLRLIRAEADQLT